MLSLTPAVKLYAWGPIQKARFLHNFTAQNARCQAGSELMLAC